MKYKITTIFVCILMIAVMCVTTFADDTSETIEPTAPSVEETTTALLEKTTIAETTTETVSSETSTEETTTPETTTLTTPTLSDMTSEAASKTETTTQETTTETTSETTTPETETSTEFITEPEGQATEETTEAITESTAETTAQTSEETEETTTEKESDTEEETSAQEEETTAEAEKKKKETDDASDATKITYDLISTTNTVMDKTVATVDPNLKEKIGYILGNDTIFLSKTQYSILEAASNEPAAPAGYCATWVSRVFSKIGFSIGGDANGMWATYCNSSDPNELQPGMIIAVQHAGTDRASLGYIYGHVGIYVGDGKVADSHSEVVSTSGGYTYVAGVTSVVSLEYWLTKYDTYNTVKWGYPSDIAEIIFGEFYLSTPDVTVKVLTNENAKERQNKVLVTWRPDANAKGYLVYKNGKPVTIITDNEKSFYMDTDVTEGMDYYYRIVSFISDSQDNFIKESEMSWLLPSCFANIPILEEEIIEESDENIEIISSASDDISKLTDDELRIQILDDIDAMMFQVKKNSSEYFDLSLKLHSEIICYGGLDKLFGQEPQTEQSDENQDDTVKEVNNNVIPENTPVIILPHDYPQSGLDIWGEG